MESEKKIAFANIEIYTIVILFLFMMVSLFFQVATRNLFSYSSSWIEQVAKIMFVWITLAGISLAAGKSMHLRVSIIATVFPKKIGPIFLLLGDLVAVFFGFYMAYYIYENMTFLMETWQVFSSVRWLPVWVMYLPGVLGMIGFSMRIIQTSIYPAITKLVKKDTI